VSLPIRGETVNVQQSYTVTLCCGCIVYVSCHPLTGIAHTRILERRAAACGSRAHMIGARLKPWELLPETNRDPAAPLIVTAARVKETRQ
jgi:hypothetical protein